MTATGAPVGASRAGSRGVSAATARGERGAVAAEAAAVLPVLVAVALGLVWLVSLAAGQVRAVDAAREAARVAARGESDEAAVALGRRVAPSGSTITVTRGDDDVRVVVEVAMAAPGDVLGLLPTVELRAESVAFREPR